MWNRIDRRRRMWDSWKIWNTFVLWAVLWEQRCKNYILRSATVLSDLSDEIPVVSDTTSTRRVWSNVTCFQVSKRQFTVPVIKHLSTEFASRYILQNILCHEESQCHTVGRSFALCLFRLSSKMACRVFWNIYTLLKWNGISQHSKC